MKLRAGNKKKSLLEDEVCRAISEIPAGKVSTYKEIARHIGRRNAFRAVGNALNSNPNAPKIACHRIIRSDGQVGGYRYGQDKKISLLKKEGIEICSGKAVRFLDYLYIFPARRKKE